MRITLTCLFLFLFAVNVSAQTPPVCPTSGPVLQNFPFQVTIQLPLSELTNLIPEANVDGTVHQLPKPVCTAGAGSLTSCTLTMPTGLTEGDHDVMFRPTGGSKLPGPWTPTCRYKISTQWPPFVVIGIIPPPGF